MPKLQSNVVRPLSPSVRAIFVVAVIMFALAVTFAVLAIKKSRSDYPDHILMRDVRMHAKDTAAFKDESRHALQRYAIDLAGFAPSVDIGTYQSLYPLLGDQWCASNCRPYVDCYLLVIHDVVNDIDLALPCKNGAVGAWVIKQGR